MYQAKLDTGQPPSHADWTCLAAAGRDANSITVRGMFNETAEYRRLDVVALNGGSFIALKDAPGPCPGPGWQLLPSVTPSSQIPPAVTVSKWLLIKRFRQCLRALVCPHCGGERLGYPARCPRTRRRGIYLCGLSA
jgi:hypothetical protein